MICTIQADAARGFDALFKDKSRTEAGCSAHSRRRYYDCLPIEPKICDDVLDIYEKLYESERKFCQKAPNVILAARRKFSKPLIKALYTKIRALKGALNPTHALMSAVDYTLNHWIALCRFLKNPDIDLGRVNDRRGGIRFRKCLLPAAFA